MLNIEMHKQILEAPTDRHDLIYVANNSKLMDITKDGHLSGSCDCCMHPHKLIIRGRV